MPTKTPLTRALEELEAEKAKAAAPPVDVKGDPQHFDAVKDFFAKHPEIDRMIIERHGNSYAAIAETETGRVFSTHANDSVESALAFLALNIERSKADK